jgi:hypothetical protein
VLNLDRARWVVAVLPEQSDDDRHRRDLPQRGATLVQAFE